MLSKAKAYAEQRKKDLAVATSKLVKEQKKQFGVDKDGQQEVESAAKDYAERRRKDRVKKGKEADQKDMQWDTVLFVDRYGEEHYVSQAKAEEMQVAEEEAMLDLEVDGVLPPPKLPRLFKDPDFNAIQLKINWTVPSDFGDKDSIKHCVVRWKKTNHQHSDRNDLWGHGSSDLSAKGKVEYISTKTKEDQALEGRKDTMKIIKNKRARFIEIKPLTPATEYEILVSFVYTAEALAQHVAQGGVLQTEQNDGESATVGPLVVSTADALLQCGNCGSTLNWGIEECSAQQCRGSEVSLQAWNR
tara:strand:- start:7 stop:912 length:906 start_codon:yes stop_codon:yes gene_type:complete